MLGRALIGSGGLGGSTTKTRNFWAYNAANIHRLLSGLPELSSAAAGALQSKLVEAISLQIDKVRLGEPRANQSLEEWDYMWDALAWEDQLFTTMSLQSWAESVGESYGYDTSGRTTSVATSAGTTTLAYDYEGRVSGITYPSSTTNSFTYNGLDTRVGKTDSNGTNTFRRDGVGVTAPVLADGSTTYTPGIHPHGHDEQVPAHGPARQRDSPDRLG